MDDLFSDVPVDDLPQDIDYHAELVGEGKKFKTDADLAKGKFHADKTIEALTKKLDELQQELKTKTTMEDFMTQMKNSQSQPQPPQNDVGTPAPNQNAGDNSDLEARIEALLQQREQSRSSASNLEKVKLVLAENFGPDANLVINKKARELQMSVSELQALAQKSPAAFFNLVGASENPSHEAAPVFPRNSVNSVGGVNSGVVRNAKFYEKMKREDPKRYFSNQTTVDQIRDATALGDRFYD